MKHRIAGTAVLAVSILTAAAAAAQSGPPPWYAPQQQQDPYAQQRLQQCRDLGSYAVVDPPGGNSGQINVSSGSSCADLPSLQPNFMPYVQLNVDAGGIPVQDNNGANGWNRGNGWSNGGWNPHGGVRVR